VLPSKPPPGVARFFLGGRPGSFTACCWAASASVELDSRRRSGIVKMVDSETGSDQPSDKLRVRDRRASAAERSIMIRAPATGWRIARSRMSGNSSAVRTLAPLPPGGLRARNPSRAPALVGSAGLRHRSTFGLVGKRDSAPHQCRESAEVYPDGLLSESTDLAPDTISPTFSHRGDHHFHREGIPSVFLDIRTPEPVRGRYRSEHKRARTRRHRGIGKERKTASKHHDQVQERRRPRAWGPVA